jgi:diaminopimelate epimerase
MHGAANDFILVDDRETTFPAEDRDWVAGIAARRTGVGSDGVLLIQPSEAADFRMRFFNPDGGEAEMCGNGARCVARLAHEIGAAPAEMSIDTVAGMLRAEARGSQVLLHMTDPVDVRLNQEIMLGGAATTYHFANTGVPHVVVPVEQVEEVDVAAKGAALRYHEAFAPAGANANFVAVAGPDHLRVRTYERGVEAETLACGTGVVACGVTAGLAGLVSSPVRITVHSGDELVVDYASDGSAVSRVTLLGPTVHVFRGVLEYDASSR